MLGELERLKRELDNHSCCDCVFFPEREAETGRKDRKNGSNRPGSTPRLYKNHSKGRKSNGSLNGTRTGTRYGIRYIRCHRASNGSGLSEDGAKDAIPKAQDMDTKARKEGENGPPLPSGKPNH